MRTGRIGKGGRGRAETETTHSAEQRAAAAFLFHRVSGKAALELWRAPRARDAEGSRAAHRVPGRSARGSRRDDDDRRSQHKPEQRAGGHAQRREQRCEPSPPLAGAEFVRKDSDGKEIATWTSTTNSYVIQNLPNGTYTLQETKAPEGYVLNDQIVEFTITDTNRNIAIRFKNKEVEKKATIVKIDSVTKDPVAGATLVVKNSQGEEVVRFTTTTEPYVLNDLEDGTYTVEEISAPEGYEKTDEIYDFTIDNNNRDVKVTIENKAVEKLVNILKVDAATGKPLAGATLVVKDSEGNVIEEFVTTEEPHTITGLKDGTYTVEETKAPEGYTKSDEVYKFTISNKTPTALVIFENNEIVEVPFTGSNTSLISTLFGSIMLISGVGFVYYNGKKQKVK